VVAFKKKKEFLLPEIGTRAEKTYFVIGGLLLPLLVYAGAGYWEKSLSFTDVKTKYEDLANDPIVIMGQLKHSATFNIPIAKDDPIYGAPNAQFSIILFSDFQCPICAKTEQFLKLIVDMNHSDLNLVYKNYPLSNECNSFLLGSLHPDACKAARAGYAAFLLNGPEGFWRYGDLLFSNQNTLKSERWLEFARATGLDQAGFQGLMQPDSPAMEKVRRDIQQGVDLKISSTPMVYFKGKNIPQTFKGDYFVDALEELIRMNHPELKDFQLRRR
jgi:protein-disulfide isomerase